jgi:hypothetical protein
MARFDVMRFERDMMARRRRQQRGQGPNDRIRPFGLLLAMLALLSQSLVMLLPVPATAMAMPEMASGTGTSVLPADATLFPGGYILCEDDDGPPLAPDTDKTPCQHCVDCPVCQAFHAPGGLVPPGLPALPVPALETAAFVPTVVRPHPLRLAALAHQPRAPPSIVRF